MQFPTIAIGSESILLRSERELEAKLPIAPNAVGILGHYLKGRGSIVGVRAGSRRFIDVRFQGVFAVGGEFIGEDFDLVGSRDRQDWKPKRKPRYESFQFASA